MSQSYFVHQLLVCPLPIHYGTFKLLQIPCIQAKLKTREPLAKQTSDGGPAPLMPVLAAPFSLPSMVLPPHTGCHPLGAPTFVPLSSPHCACSLSLSLSLSLSHSHSPRLPSLPFLLLLPLFSLLTLKDPFASAMDTSHILCCKIKEHQIYLVQAALAFSTAKIPGDVLYATG